jgi:hypothetical protein
MMKKRRVTTPDELEAVVNTALGLRETQGSGCVKGNADGIGISDDEHGFPLLMNESKFTEKIPASISVRKKDWDKTVKAARRYGRIPVMSRGDIGGSVHIVIDLDDFAYLYACACMNIRKEKNE